MTITNNTYARSHDWTVEAANGNPISSTKMDTEFDGITEALNLLLGRDTYIEAAQVGGTAAAITLDARPNVAAHVNGVVYAFAVKSAQAAATNVTIAVDGQTARPLRTPKGYNIPVSRMVVGRVLRVMAIPNAFVLLNDHDVLAPSSALVDGPTIAWDLGVAPNARVTITADRTLGSPTNGEEGHAYVLAVKQDATGGHSLTAASTGFDLGALAAISVGDDANEVTLLGFIHVFGKLRLISQRGGYDD